VELRVAERTGELNRANEELAEYAWPSSATGSVLGGAQKAQPHGSFGWSVSNPARFLWSEETYRIFQYDRNDGRRPSNLSPTGSSGRRGLGETDLLSARRKIEKGFFGMNIAW